jgi:hypothetical protein
MAYNYIPTRTEKFYIFEQFLTEQVVANGAQWGLPANLTAELQSRSSAYAQLFGTVVNREVRTPQQVMAHQEGRMVYTSFLRQLVQGYLVNNPTIPFDVKRAIGLRPRGERGSRPAIQMLPKVALKNIGGSRVQFEVRMPDTDGRVRMHPDSNAVELQLRIVEVQPAMPRNVDMSGAMPATAITTMTLLRTRARFIEELGHQGRMLHVKARYVNTVTPSKSGPWSMEVTLVIS